MENLPDSNSPHLHLVPATPSELLAQQKANSTEWRGALTLETYLRREDHLLQQPLTKDGGLTPWMLVYQPPSENSGEGGGGGGGGVGREEGTSRQVLCGCESIRKKALIAKEGKVEDGVAHGVASVFCPPRFRGKGFAGRMISEVGTRLEGWQVGEEEGGRSAFSVLFSDIGKEFYARHGWAPFPSGHVTLPAKVLEEGKIGLVVRRLGSRDLAELCEVDEQLMRRNLAKSSTSSGRATVALVPDIATIQWHAAREDFVFGELHANESSKVSLQDRRGSMVGDKPGSRVWCYWTRIWTNPQEEAPNTLHILRLVIENEEDPATTEAIAALPSAAKAEAKASGMDEVQLWNPSETTLAAVRQLDPSVGMVQREKESIASLRWYGDGSWEDVDWVGNEKYGWC